MNEEKEIKILLTKDEYQKLDGIFDWSKDYIQTNHYYGGEEDIISKTNTYRVRDKNGKIKIQIKMPVSYDGSLHIKKEYEKEINSVPEVLSKEELSEITGKDFKDDKEYIGKLETRRKECLKYDNVEICLDKNNYLGKIDYEIEIEFKGEYPKDVISILEKNGVRADASVLGKYSRYMRTLVAKRNTK